jgi:hypothetical protein
VHARRHAIDALGPCSATTADLDGISQGGSSATRVPSSDAPLNNWTVGTGEAGRANYKALVRGMFDGIRAGGDIDVAINRYLAADVV